MRQRRKSYREYEDDDDEPGDDLAAVNERLDNLTRQLERVAQTQVGAGKRNASGDDEPSSERVSEALTRLDRRLDQIIADSRNAPAEPERLQRHAPPQPLPPQPLPPPAPHPHLYAPPPAPSPALPPLAYAPPPAPPAPPAPGPANWAAEISARQRALDGGATVAPMRAAPHHVAPQLAVPQHAPYPAAPHPAHAPSWPPAHDLSGLEHHLRNITTQIATMHRPYEDALTALRGDLAEVGRALTEAMPRRAVEALESEVRALADRVDRSRQSGADSGALATLEQGLAEIRDALRTLTPAESLVGFEDAVRGLSHKIDQIAVSNQDPIAFHQLEQAIGSLRGIVANVASDGALAQLSAEVHGLAARFERAASESSTEALAKLENRIALLMETGRAVPPELEGSIRSLSERLDRMQLSPSDQLAIGSLEDRIARLAEKLDASDARLNNLGAIERGMADLLIHLEEMKGGTPRAPRASAPVAAEPPRELPPAPRLEPRPEPQPVMAPPPVFMPPAEVLPPPPPAPPPQQVARPAPQQQQRQRAQQPIDPNLPPDTPLEPGSGVPRSKPGSPAARIAASKAALGSADPAISEIGSMTASVAAARGAARSAAAEAPSEKVKSSWFKWPAKPKKEKKPKAERLPPPPKVIERPADVDDGVVMVSPVQRVLKFGKSLLIAGSVVAITLGALQVVMNLISPSEGPATPTLEAPASKPAASPSSRPSRPMPAPGGALPTPDATTPETPGNGAGNGESAPGAPSGAVGGQSSIFDPSTVLKPPPADVTGSISRKPQPARPASSANPAVAALPASFGPLLRNGAAASDPAAEYEIAARYADGHGVPPSLNEAARWFQRAASTGFAPAEYRLASLYERGQGVKKDLNAARELYVAAAAKGHAKSMHNLAVLNAEGIDGKPDYKVAAQWFLKAAAYGIADSQYNLAILYARGIGIEQNLAESYKWFALAALKGDADSAKKRDDVAARLDQQTLTAAKLAVQTFVPAHEPDEAVGLKVPPGGWDHAAPAKPRHRITTSAAR